MRYYLRGEDRDARRTQIKIESLHSIRSAAPLFDPLVSRIVLAKQKTSAGSVYYINTERTRVEYR